MPENLVQDFQRITDILGSGRPDPWGDHPSGDEKGEIDSDRSLPIITVRTVVDFSEVDHHSTHCKHPTPLDGISRCVSKIAYQKVHLSS